MDKRVTEPAGRKHLIDLAPKPADFAAEVLDGLGGRPRRIAPKFFYDAAGSDLFDQICELPEYYPTRTELALLDQIAPDIRALAGPGATVIEFGAGGARKAHLLLNALDDPARYTAIEISRAAIEATLEDLGGHHPDLDLMGICADFMAPLDFDREWLGAGRRICFFPGSTLGNFERPEALAFLRNARTLAGPDGAMLLGVDLIKDRAVLHAAYNDAAGVTAAFNLNLLARMERELEAQLDTGHFTHHAFFNEDRARIEMHLRATRPTQIALHGHRFGFDAGDTIHTESSHKYTLDALAELARAAGWNVEKSWTDPRGWFSLSWLCPMTVS
mgnify:CR=1 FL=1